MSAQVTEWRPLLAVAGAVINEYFLEKSKTSALSKNFVRNGEHFHELDPSTICNPGSNSMNNTD